MIHRFTDDDEWSDIGWLLQLQTEARLAGLGDRVLESLSHIQLD